MSSALPSISSNSQSAARSLRSPANMNTLPFTNPADRPTAVQRQAYDLSVTSSKVNMLLAKMNAQTAEIIRHPYDPQCWTQRARTLAQLQYPELAVGDAYKARSLCRSLLGSLDSKSHHRLGHRFGFWIIDETERSEAETDYYHEYLAKLQSEAHRIEAENLYYFPEWEEGRFMRQPYPWMSEEHSRRSNELLAEINDEFNDAAPEGQSSSSCIVKRHAFAEHSKGRDNSDILGVFAKCNIRKDEVLVIDESNTWGCTRRGGHKGLANGSVGCTDPLHSTAPTGNATCDLRWIRDRAGSRAAEVILRCRFLLRCVEDNVSHPLDHTLIARLTPFYRPDKAVNFHLEDDIAIPNHALQQFGIDIFANLNYDTWVLFTIRERIANNDWSDPMHHCINPLFSLFNHSCEPNVAWKAKKDFTMIIRASRDIQEGEQLFVEYDGYLTKQPLEVRRTRLLHWLDGPCQCTRCLREEQELCELKHSPIAAANGTAAWDVEERPVFPEDALSPEEVAAGVRGVRRKEARRKP